MLPKESLITQYSNTASSFKSSARPSEEYTYTYIAIPPDGGWGWVIVFAAFCCNFVGDGTMYTLGLFLNDISETFHTTPAHVGLVSSLMTGFYYFLGPATCALVNHMGFRLPSVFGGLLAAMAFGLSTFFTSLTAFLVVLGVFGGFGISLLYVPSVIVTGFYFERWRALATSIAMTGAAAGMMIIPILMHALSNYSWQNRFYVISALCLSGSVLSLLYRPVEPVQVLMNKDHAVVQIVPSDHSSDDKEKPKFFDKIYDRFHNVKYPTHAELYKESTVLLFSPGPSVSSVIVNSVETSTSFVAPTVSRNLDNRSEKFDKLSVIYENDIRKKKCCRCQCFTCCPRRFINRPMYRDDIFYGGSLATLTDRGLRRLSMKQDLHYTMSVTRGHLKDPHEERIHFNCCPESVLRTLVTMLHFQLLKSVPFLIFSVSGFFTVLGMFIPFVYLIERSTEFGIKKDTSHYFYTTVGISNAIGRVLSGVISSIPHANTALVVTVSLSICGLSTILSCFLKDIYSQFAYYTIFGLTLSSFATLRSPIVVDILGLENLTNAFGLMLLFNGLAAYLGVPIAGKIITLTNSYNNGFLFSGSVLLFSGFLAVFIIRKKRQPL